MTFACVLFDLDGTLLDTAPDLIAALNRSLKHYGVESVAESQIRPFISYGALAMIQQSSAHDNDVENILDKMLADYQQRIAENTVFFEGMEQVLASLETQQIKWGVVTNKRQRFTLPLMDALNLSKRTSCIISGDSAEHPKPHTAPMLMACRQAEVNPEQCLYIGDALHDIEAGKNSGMKTLAAAYGYLKADDDIHSWQADAIIQKPLDILSWMQLCH